MRVWELEVTHGSETLDGIMGGVALLNINMEKGKWGT